jgi:hypothetical protein
VAAASPSAIPSRTLSPSPAEHVLPPGILSGNLGVHDQHGDGTQVTVSPEIDGADGWVVVQADDGGRRGEVLGLAHRTNQAHDDVIAIPLRRKVSTGRLWVTIHVDAGRRGVFEYPGPDRPLQSRGGDLTQPITLTVP